MYDIPTTITVGEQEYRIRNDGDYRTILDCFVVLNDSELSSKERIIACLMIFLDGFDSIEDVLNLPDIEETVKQMYTFFNCGEDGSLGATVNYKLIDWEQDSQLISSAINKVAGKEIRSEKYIHWWTFMGYYLAIGESPLSNIVGIRHKIVTGKKLEKYEQQFKRENPQYFMWNSATVERKEADELARQLWNSN